MHVRALSRWVRWIMTRWRDSFPLKPGNPGSLPKANGFTRTPADYSNSGSVHWNKTPSQYGPSFFQRLERIGCSEGSHQKSDWKPCHALGAVLGSQKLSRLPAVKNELGCTVDKVAAYFERQPRL